MADEISGRLMAGDRSRTSAAFVDAFFQGFTGAGFFGPLPQPGAPAQLFDNEPEQSLALKDRSQAQTASFGLRAKVFRGPDTPRSSARMAGFHRRRPLRSQA